MALDVKECTALEERVGNLINELEKDKRRSSCFDESWLKKLKVKLEEFHSSFEEAKHEGRNLRIGIIGAVKAGKSSFLNTLFFNGNERLPKAATPMTAALTIIKYSENPGAVIHYYDKITWNEIINNADKYDKLLDTAYKKYLEDYQKKEQEAAVQGLSTKRRPKLDKKSFEEEFLRTYLEKEENEELLAAKELYTMATKQGLEFFSDKIGTEERIEECELNNYIGADGEYTPIVNYVELFIDDKKLDGFEIVDTPGLNDPIVSRTEKTKEYLSKVDVAILLSSTSQFMDASTFGLMINAFPSCGIKDIIVVGSKLDSGMLDYKDTGVSIKKVYHETRGNCQKHLRGIINNALFSDSSVSRRQIEGSPVVFISSILYNIAYKKKNSIALNDEEQHIYIQLGKYFTEFDDKLLPALSGFKEIRTELKKVLGKKEEIINQRSAELYRRYLRAFIEIFREMRDDAFQRKDRLENTDIEELTRKVKAINSTLESVRRNLRHICKLATDDTVKRAEKVKSRLLRESGSVEKPEVKERPENHSSTSGAFFWKKTERWVEHIHYVETADASSKIRDYVGRINGEILEHFENILQKTELAEKVKNEILPAIHNYAGNYDEKEILIPLEDTISGLSIIKIDIDPNKYSDKIKSAYKKGEAKNNEIHKFMDLFDDIISQITAEAGDYIKGQIIKIEGILPFCMDDFIDKLSEKFNKQVEILENDKKDKETTLKKYNDFLTYIDKFIRELNK